PVRRPGEGLRRRGVRAVLEGLRRDRSGPRPDDALAPRLIAPLVPYPVQPGSPLGRLPHVNMRTIAMTEEQQGDTGRRLGELYRRHAPDAARLGYLLTGDRVLAEDLVQEAFVRMFGRFRDLRNPDAFGAYLRKTVVNLSRSHFR